MSRDDARPVETRVTPTRRLAHYLKARHDHDAATRGLEVWRSPDCVSWSGLIERMFTLDRLAGRTGRRWLGDGAARLVWERMVQRDPQAAGIIAPDGLARAAYRSWRTLHDYRIPLQTAEATDGPEAALFRRWADEFAAWLDRAGWIDAVGAQDWVAPASAGPRLRFVGFDAFTPGQTAFIERMREGGVEIVVEGPPRAGGGAVWVTAVDRDAELEMAARWAARRLDGEPRARIAVVVPGLVQSRAAVRRVFDRVLAPESTVGGGPAPEAHGYELAAARPLATRPVVAAALEWLAAFTYDVDLADCSALLRSAFCRGADGEAGARAALDAWLRRHEGHDLALPRLAVHAARHACPQFAQFLQSASESCDAWTRRALPSVWSQRYFDLLQRIGWPGEGLDSDEHQARQRWQGLLGEFGAHDDVLGPVAAAPALGLLRDLAAGTLFEPQEIRAPLLVIDPETCAGMDFDALWVCGLDAAQWPAAASPDPFLARAWQVRRGVPGCSAEQAAIDARRTLERLCGSAREVILSVPAFEDEAPLLPSALLDGIPAAPVPPLWDVPAPARVVFAARPALLETVDGALPPLDAREHATGGAKLLELQAACPFRAGAELRLGARRLDEPALGLDAAARGNLVHDVFASLWREVRSSAAMLGLPAGERVARVRAAIAAELAPLRRDASGVLLRLLEIEARWLERHALQLLDLDLLRPSFTVEHVEADRKVEIGGLSLDLRVDRVDRLADGSLAVIDYKTGGQARPGAWLGERPQLPQLPLYVEAFGPANVAAVAFGRVRAGATGFTGIARDAAVFPGCKTPPREYATWNELLAAWHRRLEFLAREFAAGDARLAPDPTHACRRCHLPSLCRIGEARLAAQEEGAGDE